MSSGPSPSGTDNSWLTHVRVTLRISLPLIAAQLAQQGIQVIDTIMLGWLSTEALAASVLGTTLFFVVYILGVGVGQAVMPLASSAAGAGQDREVRRAVRMGLWAIVFVTALAIPALWQADPLLRLTGQDPALSAMAEGYLRILLWGLFPAAAITVLRSFLSAVERTGILMGATLVGVGVNALGNWMLIFGNLGAPALGLHGAAIASVLAQCVSLALIVLYIRRTPVLARFNLFLRLWRKDAEALREVFRLGLPISATLLAEVGLFSAASLMMGWLGTIPLAAHGIAMQITAVIFMVPLGFASAGTVRVGRAHGRGDGLGLERAAVCVLAMGLSVALVAAVTLWLIPGPLIALFLSADDPNLDAVLSVGAGLLVVAAVFQVVDALQLTSASLLRGIKDTRMPMLIAVISYWGLGIPSGYLLAFSFGYGGPGVWAGLAIGLACAGILLTWRFLRRDRLGLVSF